MNSGLVDVEFFHLAESISAYAQSQAEQDQPVYADPIREMIQAKVKRGDNLLYGLVSFMLTCHERNTHEWMEALVVKLNYACSMIGDDDRFIYRTKGQSVPSNGWIDRKVMP